MLVTTDKNGDLHFSGTDAQGFFAGLQEGLEKKYDAIEVTVYSAQHLMFMALAEMLGMNPDEGGGAGGDASLQKQFPNIEKEVLLLAEKGNYKAAYQKIIDALSSVFGNMSKYFQLGTSTSNHAHFTRLNSLYNPNGLYKDEKPTIVTLDESFLNCLIGSDSYGNKIENSDNYNFGDIVRQVFHEIYVHVKDYLEAV